MLQGELAANSKIVTLNQETAQKTPTLFLSFSPPNLNHMEQAQYHIGALSRSPWPLLSSSCKFEIDPSRLFSPKA
jgi:hypothetical protein